ncbi:UDP-N-acetylmuramate dehydrogenase [Alicyclobacillus tolerans]|uniref:UDP-N-acetylenolpyruvoylglucosamine reductase n=1 Tax=Alicyclobacillus tolerans TaxID=90970 RepID=A0A1M6Q3N6_9BACL|nr:UDP-N-acetylmuramate dehydrogenase [Alicyclobacillus montanus]SHK14859.1 UDP-N-acetylmuramate dehydrogenase [Alicyclobacillus montanus]
MNREGLLAELKKVGISQIRADEPLIRHTTWRIGGPADFFAEPESLIELQELVRTARRLELPVTVIGRGSNLLVLDGGIRGLVIKMHDKFSDISVHEERLTALAGRSIVSAAGIAVKHGLAGLEFATGIPGTVGGAVMMNAGAHGSEVANILEFADVLDENGELRRYNKDALRFSYRYSILKDCPGIVVRAGFALNRGDKEEISQRIKKWSQKRAATQPLSQPNCGSVFRNPEGDYSARLLEAAGLKGLRHHDAQISEKHANFIVNLGSARAVDVLWLIDHAKETVAKRYGIQLETEVRIMGEHTSGR